MKIKLSDGSSLEVDDGVDPATVDSYLKESGLKRAESGGFLNTLFGLGKSAATGLGKGVGDLVAAGGNSEPEMTGAKPEGVPDFAQTEQMLGEKVGGWHQPEGLGERAVEGGARMIPSAIAAPGEGGFLPKMFTYGFAPGALSEVAGTIAKNSPGGEYTEMPARTMTSMFSPAAIRKGITPSEISPLRRKDNAVIERAMPGIQTAGQATGKEWLQGRELARDPSLNEKQSAALTQAVTKKAGVPASEITTGPGGVVDQASKGASDALEKMSQSTSIPIHPEIQQDINNFMGVRRHQPHFDAVENIVENELGRKRLFLNNNPMTGEEYQHLRSALHSAAVNAGPSEGNALRKFATILDDAMDRTNPGSKEGWGEARRLWENSRIVEKIAEKVPSGQPKPKELENAAKKVIGGERFVKGSENPPPGGKRSDYSELARAAQRSLPPLKPRESSNWFGGSEAIGGLLGGAATQAGLMHMGLGLEHAATPAILGSMMGAYAGHLSPIKGSANAVLDRWAASPIGQRYYKNQVLPKPKENDPAMMIRALIANQQGQDQ